MAENRYKMGNGDIVLSSVLKEGESQGQGELERRVAQIILLTRGIFGDLEGHMFPF